MSALGQKRTLGDFRLMSALPPKADMDHQGCDVRFVPKADINRSFNHLVCKSMRHNLCQPGRGCPRRCEAEILAVGANEKNEPSMIDFGAGVPRRIAFGIIDLVGECDLLDGARIAGKADQPWVKQRNVTLKLFGSVLFGIDGYEQRLDRVGGRTELVDR